MTLTLRALPAGSSGLASARPEPDLAAHGYLETEYVARGTAVAYSAPSLPADGRFELTAAGTAPFATRVVVRRPDAAVGASGTVVVEWLNVSSGMDAAPDWTFAAEEILRAGHAWAGVSAQYTGVEGGGGSVPVGEDADAPPGLRDRDPERYGDLHHPGDSYCYDIYTQVAAAVREELGAGRLLAMGESQSAMALTTYANGVQPLTGLADGFLIHSRPAVPGPLDAGARGIDMAEALTLGPVHVRDDLEAPVLLVQTEGDLFDRIGYLPARQADGERLRLWEVAGAAHADRYVIGEFEDILGCAVPVNRGQQWAVVRAGLRALHRWVADGVPAPAAPRLLVAGDDFVRNAQGNVRGGVRTPVVEAPVEVLSGRPWPGASVACRLFGSTVPLTPSPWASRTEYLAAYAGSTDAVVAAGFVLAEDREAILAEARPDLVAPDPRSDPSTSGGDP